MPDNRLKPLSETRIVIVDDDPVIRRVLSHTLESEFAVETVEDGTSAIAHCVAKPPDLILLDVNMPGISGLDICRKMRALKVFSNVPILFVTGSVDLDSQNACWEAGASDFIGKPIAPSTLLHRVRTHVLNKLRYEQLERLTYKDSLTDTFNRHYLNENVDAVIKQVKRFNGYFGLLMLDVDYFKTYNDYYGHQKGDKCLVEVARAIKNALHRPQDTVVRFGGEEFLVLLPFTDEQGLKHVADNILTNLTSLNIPHEQSPIGRVSISIGGVTCKLDLDNDHSMSQLIKAADENLYSSKSNGRNQYKSTIIHVEK